MKMAGTQEADLLPMVTVFANKMSFLLGQPVELMELTDSHASFTLKVLRRPSIKPLDHVLLHNEFSAVRIILAYHCSIFDHDEYLARKDFGP